MFSVLRFPANASGVMSNPDNRLPHFLLCKRCRERDSNPHDRFGSRDFKSLVSTNSTIAAHFSGFSRKGTSISPKLQTFYQLF